MIGAALKDLARARLSLGLGLVGLAALVAAAFLGPTPIGPGRVGAALIGQGAPADTLVIWSIRLPRALAAYAVGLALGASGAGLQGLLRNPLAEPGVLGVSACGALGATTALYYGLAAVSPWMTPLFAVAGALGATLVLGAVAVRVVAPTTLILVGVGLSSFAGAVMALLLNLAPNPFTLSDLINWTLGSVANRSLEDLALSAPFLVAGAGLLLIARRGLSALTLGEDAAAGIGVDVARVRLFVVGGAGLATGGAVALAGVIGFVGIIAPHLVRPFVGHDPGRAMIPSALLAGALLVVADLLARTAPSTNELKLGVVAALIGAPVFVWIAAGGRLADRERKDAA